MGHAIRKRVFGHMRTAKAQICAVWAKSNKGTGQFAQLFFPAEENMGLKFLITVHVQLEKWKHFWHLPYIWRSLKETKNPVINGSLRSVTFLCWIYKAMISFVVKTSWIYTGLVCSIPTNGPAPFVFYLVYPLNFVAGIWLILQFLGTWPLITWLTNIPVIHTLGVYMVLEYYFYYSAECKFWPLLWFRW